MDSREFGIEGSTEIGFLWVRTIGLRLDIHRGDCRGGDRDRQRSKTEVDGDVSIRLN